jgi:hypothetical protein
MANACGNRGLPGGFNLRSPTGWQAIELPEAGGRVHPRFGVFAPIRREYVDLVSTTLLPAACASASRHRASACTAGASCPSAERLPSTRTRDSFSIEESDPTGVGRPHDAFCFSNASRRLSSFLILSSSSLVLLVPRRALNRQRSIPMITSTASPKKIVQVDTLDRSTW